jgi:2-C-methyl-D-erythritol 4-phosphate cytidylyltransferase
LIELKKYALIVAGGNGSRMQSQLPKQFIRLNKVTILAHTINKFLSCNCEVVIVLPKAHFETFKQEVLDDCSAKELMLAEGGETRFESVKNGLNLVPPNSLVAIHDAVRPFVSKTIIENSFKIAQEKGSAIAAVDLKDSIRVITQNGNEAKDRSLFKLIQTPQTFKTNELLKAYKVFYKDYFTDDASVWEADGNTVTLIEGDYKNIKITTPEDLLVAKAFI